VAAGIACPAKRFDVAQFRGVALSGCMKRPEAIRELANREEASRARGATSLFVFGSTARDEADGNSDLNMSSKAMSASVRKLPVSRTTAK
jgi:hypothetical protein